MGFFSFSAIVLEGVDGRECVGKWEDIPIVHRLYGFVVVRLVHTY